MTKSVIKEIFQKIGSDVRKSPFFSILSSAAESFSKRWHLSVLNMVVDIIFMVALSFTVLYMQLGVMDHLTELMKIGGELTGGLTNIYNQIYHYKEQIDRFYCLKRGLMQDLLTGKKRTPIKA